ncbi:hypothetical protein Bca52824_084264 [Brassica carinata]|uniref:Uncharacterized protein n=1 Tax=Brassica carinata TaxID=52824 RepID=A0A8X7PNB5_BRACI|nr:hypothetical protein Bca52824_084264 [Brassica carinata]
MVYSSKPRLRFLALEQLFLINYGDPSFLSQTLPFYPPIRLAPTRLTLSSSTVCCLSERINHASTIKNDEDISGGLRVVISAGGTAGHLLGASHRRRAEIRRPARSNPLHRVPKQHGEHHRPLRRIRLLGDLHHSPRVQTPDRRRHRRTLLVCFAAAIMRLKLVIQEQDSIPGTTNWILSLFADTIFTPFNCTVTNLPKRAAAKCVVYGNPIRQALRRYVSKGAARVSFFGQWAELCRTRKLCLCLAGLWEQTLST